MFLPDTAAQPTDGQAGLSPLDYAVVVLYFALMLGLGYFIGRRQKSADEYFLAGRGMPWFAVGLSILASLLSTISYLATPGEMIKNGVAVLAGRLAVPFIYLVVGFGVIPYFMRLRVTSAYEYLEMRFDLATRLFGSVLFILIRISWMGLIVFTAAGALEEITGLPYVLIVTGVGLIAIVYTTLGGLRAVIWTDVVQFVFLFGGALFTVLYVATDTGTGPVTWWRNATGIDRPAQPIFSLDPFVRVTWVGMVISQFFWWVCTACSDQVAIQRYLSTSSIKDARRSFACNLVAGVLTGCLLALCGIALYSFYPQLPGKPDDAFPHFIAHEMPPVLAGLVVAALFSAAMSSIDSGMNSIATVITVDFFRRLRKTALASRQEVTLARVITAVVGILALSMCLLLKRIPDETRGNITDATSQINTFIVGGLAGLFLIAMFLRRCIGPVAIASTLIGMTTGFFMALGHYFDDPPAYYLVVRSGPELVGKRWLLSHQTPNSIGADPDSSRFVLPGEGVAGRHAEIRWTGDGWRIENLADWDKTLVGTRPVTRPVELDPANVIVVGPYKLRLERKMISWMWVIPCSCVVTFLTGLVLSVVLVRLSPPERKAESDLGSGLDQRSTD